MIRSATAETDKLEDPKKKNADGDARFAPDQLLHEMKRFVSAHDTSRALTEPNGSTPKILHSF